MRVNFVDATNGCAGDFKNLRQAGRDFCFQRIKRRIRRCRSPNTDEFHCSKIDLDRIAAQV